MASAPNTTPLPTAAASAQNVVLPDMPELFNENFLDVLVPLEATTKDVIMDTSAPPPPTIPMISVLDISANWITTTNGAPALRSTLSATLDAFQGITNTTPGRALSKLLDDAWAEDPQLTLRIIWCLRSIPDGKGNKLAFYRAFAWLFERHPRTAIINLRQLVEPVSLRKRAGGKKETMVSHGYWKDLLNIIALATTDELKPAVMNPVFMNSRNAYRSNRYNSRRCRQEEDKQDKEKLPPAEERIAAHLANNAQKSQEARTKRTEKFTSSHSRLSKKLVEEPKFRALYIAVARLFAEKLAKDMHALQQLEGMPEGSPKVDVVRRISLAGKWAPSPGLSHDKVTNLSSAIALLLSKSHLQSTFPKALQDPALDPRQQFVALRSFLARWVLRPLCQVLECPEPKMAAKKWDQIKYTRVPSVCMKNACKLFLEHDGQAFKQFLTDVEKGRKTISGTTLVPNDLIGTIRTKEKTVDHLETHQNTEKTETKKREAESHLRVAAAQWKALVDNIKAAGTFNNSLAICQMSGQTENAAIALTLLVAAASCAPFNGGFIKFATNPRYVKLDFSQPVSDIIEEAMRSDWGYNTKLFSVFTRLLLPLAKKNAIKPEDMIKRLFIFSDMQFDAVNEGETVWETNYDMIEAAYKKAGYEVPQIVYWDVNPAGTTTYEVVGDKKGVAVVKGELSPALLKVFMGEVEEDPLKAEEFTAINVMKKALGIKSYDGLVVVD